VLLLLLPCSAASCQQRSRHGHCDVCWHCYLNGDAEELEGWGEWELGRWVLQLMLGHLHRQEVGQATAAVIIAVAAPNPNLPQ
jgi:hypothetical protein